MTNPRVKSNIKIFIDSFEPHGSFIGFLPKEKKKQVYYGHVSEEKMGFSIKN